MVIFHLDWEEPSLAGPARDGDEDGKEDEEQWGTR